MNRLTILLGLLACPLLISAIEAEDEGDNYIVGGRNAEPGQYPWMVSLRGDTHYCGGYILSNRWIGTAARCVIGHLRQPESINAAVGAHSRFDGVIHRIARIIRHPRYNTRFTYPIFNVAVLQTTAEIQFNARVQPVNFPTRAIVPDGATVVIAGWGRTDIRKDPNRKNAPPLQWKITRTISRAECRKRHGPGRRAGIVVQYTFCTFRPGVSSCGGDLGNPVIIPVQRNGPQRPQEGLIIGHVVFAIDCARGRPDIHQNFWPIIPFLRAATKNSIPNLPQGPA